MKKVLLILSFLVVSFLTINAATYYVAPADATPAGNDAAAGTIGAPWLHLEVAINRLEAGDILYMRGGTYRSAYGATTNVHNLIENVVGTSGSPILVEAYQDEVPIFNMDNLAASTTIRHAMVISDCAYLTIRDLFVTENYVGSTNPIWGVKVDDCSHVTLDNMTVSYIGGYGFTCEPGCDNITFLNCDSHHNDDVYGALGPHENANGFGVTGGVGPPVDQFEVNNSTPITFDGCRAWMNGDDGFDFMGANGFITVKNCWAFWNGYDNSFNALGDGNGFKLGPPTIDYFSTHKRDVFNNIAAQNRMNGFDHNPSIEVCIQHVYNNTAYDNGSIGFVFHTDWLGTGPAHILRNNISYANDNSWTGGGSYAGTVHDHNTWDASVTVTDADFLSVVVSVMDDARAADGTLPTINTVRLVSSSDLVDAGVDVGLSYTGDAPDIGAWEYAAENPVVVPTVVTNAVYAIHATSATGSGNVTNAGGGTVTERGVCWGTSANPTTAGDHDNSGTGTGSYTIAITGLTKGTLYHARAYAINSAGTAYGDDVTFTTTSGIVFLIIEQ